MAIPRKLYEKRAIVTALQTYLSAAGWSDLQYNDRYTEDQLTVPKVSVRFVPNTIRALQMGSVEGGDRVFVRTVQVDIYMESEERSETLQDDIMEFFDLVPVTINDASSQFLGTLICYDNESIYADTLPPATSQPPVIQWRGIIRAQMEAHYPNS